MIKEILKDMFEELDYPIWIKDKNNEIIYMNEQFQLNINNNLNIYKEEKDKFILLIREIDRKSTNFIELGDKLYKHIVYFHEKSNYMIGMLIDLSDIGEIVNMQYDKHILKTVIDNIPELIFYKDKNLKYMGLNKECKKFYESMGVKEVIGKNDLELSLDREFIKQCNEHDKLVLNSKKPLYIEESAGGKIFETIKTPIINDDGKVAGLVGVVRDISDYKNKEKILRKLSYTDSLTKIYNRTYFDEIVNRLMEEEKYPIGLILGDVNGLKIVNDTLGHLEGDKLLVKISQILEESSKGIGSVFRWGGDEFIILLPQSSSHQCAEVMKRVNELCDNSKWGNINLSISQGYSLLQKGNRIDDILAEAEDKVYKQKLLSDKSVRISMLQNLKENLESKNFETEMHTQRVATYCKEIAKKLKLDEEMIEKVALIGNLHDIGKIGISEHILLKQGKLTEEEYEIIKTHSEKGYRLACLLPEISSISREILTHHERWDGKGYPLGLQKDEIPILARIVSVADSFDAMTNERCYSSKISIDEAINELERCSGKQFDPHIVDVFIEIIKNQY